MSQSHATIRRLVLGTFAAVLSLGSPAAAHQAHELVNWTGTSSGNTSGTVLGRSVALAGEIREVGSTFDGSYQGWHRPHFTPPVAASDELELRGINGSNYTLSFSAPVSNPALHLGSLASTLAFPPGTSITKVSGQSSLVVSGSSVSGTASAQAPDGTTDSNGTVRLNGSFSSISFSATPTFGDGSTLDGIYFQASMAVPAPQPDTTITEGPAGEVWDANARFAFTSSIPGSTFECQLDGGAFVPCASPHAAGVLPVGAHYFRVRARSPRGAADFTPARRDFKVVGAYATRAACEIRPVPLIAFADWHLGDATCDIARQPARCPGLFHDSCRPDFCFTGNRCTWRDVPCPVGARCRVVGRVGWFDADPGVPWKPFVAAGFSEYLDHFPHTGSAEGTCRTGPEDDRCFATATASRFGDGKPFYVRCGQGYNPFYEKNPGDFGPAHIRRMECDADMFVEPARALSAAAAGGTIQVYAPGPGTLGIAFSPPTGGASSAQEGEATAKRRRRRPRIASIRRKAAKRGPVTVKPKLNAAARRLLRGRGRVRVNLTIRFIAANGQKSKRTARVTLTPKAPKRTVCRKRKKGCRR